MGMLSMSGAMFAEGGSFFLISFSVLGSFIFIFILFFRQDTFSKVNIASGYLFIKGGDQVGCPMVVDICRCLCKRRAKRWGM